MTDKKTIQDFPDEWLRKERSKYRAKAKRRRDTIKILTEQAITFEYAVAALDRELSYRKMRRKDNSE